MSMKKELQYKNGLYLVKTDPTWLVFFIIVKIILIFIYQLLEISGKHVWGPDPKVGNYYCNVKE